jgi:hypothetical protein
MKGLTLGDLRKLDLPDDTPIVLDEFWSSWHARSASISSQIPLNPEGGSSPTGRWAILYDRESMTDQTRTVILIR